MVPRLGMRSSRTAFRWSSRSSPECGRRTGFVPRSMTSIPRASPASSKPPDGSIPPAASHSRRSLTTGSAEPFWTRNAPRDATCPRRIAPPSSTCPRCSAHIRSWPFADSASPLRPRGRPQPSRLATGRALRVAGLCFPGSPRERVPPAKAAGHPEERPGPAQVERTAEAETAKGTRT